MILPFTEKIAQSTHTTHTRARITHDTAHVFTRESKLPNARASDTRTHVKITGNTNNLSFIAATLLALKSNACCPKARLKVCAETGVLYSWFDHDKRVGSRNTNGNEIWLQAYIAYQSEPNVHTHIYIIDQREIEFEDWPDITSNQVINVTSNTYLHLHELMVILKWIN